MSRGDDVHWAPPLLVQDVILPPGGPLLLGLGPLSTPPPLAHLMSSSGQGFPGLAAHLHLTGGAPKWLQDPLSPQRPLGPGGPEEPGLGREPSDSVEGGKVLRPQTVCGLEIGAPRAPPAGAVQPAHLLSCPTTCPHLT